MKTLARALLVLLLALILGASALMWTYRGDYPVTPIELRQTAFKPRQPTAVKASSDRVVVLLVFDGLAPDLVRSVPTPNLDRMKREGAYTLSMLPVFPTLSMPNHTTLSTGCYPEHHGIVSNRFIDPERGLYAGHLGDAIWLSGCEHITEVAERQGVRVSNLGWVGANRANQLLATHGGPLEEEALGLDERFDQVLAEIAAPSAGQARLIIGYVDEPDHTLHFKGMTAPESDAMMARVDAAVGRVQQGIEDAGLQDRTALIVTTDHGMVAADQHLNIEGILRRNQIDATFAGDATIAHLYLKDPSTRAAAAAKLARYTQLDVIFPERAPEWAHLGTSKRLGDLILSLKPPYYVFDRGIWPKHLRFAAPFAPDVLADKRLAAMHGYPPSVPGVQAVFFASGPGIARGARLDGMRSIDVHATLAKLLMLNAGTPIDGAAYPPVFAQAAAAEVSLPTE